MKYAFHKITVLPMLLAATSFAYDEYPQADRMEPRIAKTGAVLTVFGRALDKEHVEEVYLTDHRFDMKVKVLEQSDTTMKIRIPPFAKPGRLQLLLLSTGERPAYLEQPLYVQVEEADAPVPTPAAPVEVTKNQATPQPAAPQHPSRTIEIAATGRNIPVPPAEQQPAAQQSPTPHPASAPAVPAVLVKREEAPQAVAAPVPAAPVVNPAPAPAPAVAANVSRGITPPRLVRKTNVAMPSGLSLPGETSVELVAHVLTDGRVGSIRVTKGNPILGQAAMRAVREWVYECAYVGSTPVEADVTITINFRR